MSRRCGFRNVALRWRGLVRGERGGGFCRPRGFGGVVHRSCSRIGDAILKHPAGGSDSGAHRYIATRQRVEHHDERVACGEPGFNHSGADFKPALSHFIKKCFGGVRNGNHWHEAQEACHALHGVEGAEKAFDVRFGITTGFDGQKLPLRGGDMVLELVDVDRKVLLMFGINIEVDRSIGPFLLRHGRSGFLCSRVEVRIDRGGVRRRRCGITHGKSRVRADPVGHGQHGIDVFVGCFGGQPLFNAVAQLAPGFEAQHTKLAFEGVNAATDLGCCLEVIMIVPQPKCRT